MNQIYSDYLLWKETKTDINEHMELLYQLGKEVTHITEFGTGHGRSTRAFLAAISETKGTLHSYDLTIQDKVETIFENAKEASLDATLHLINILETEIEKTDLLLIDSHHTYDQVRQELEKFSDKVRKYIIFHDTELFGLSGQDPGSVGIWPAINEWLDKHPEWRTKELRYNNNGLLVVEKR